MRLGRRAADRDLPMMRDRYRGRSLGETELKGKGAVELVECQKMG
jgi:hypothetical protein